MTCLVEPYLLECPLPASHQERIPHLVSIVEKRCEKTQNSLKVIYNQLRKKEKKHKFAVCSKGLGKAVNKIFIDFIFY